MTDRDVVIRYRMLMMDAMALKEQADMVVLTGAPRGVAGQALTGMPGGTNDAVAASIQKADGYIDRLMKRREELLTICHRFEDIIEQIMDDKSRVICRYYYGTGKTDEEIAEIMSYDTRTICLLRNKAIDKISEIS